MTSVAPRTDTGISTNMLPFEIHTMTWIEENRSAFRREAHRHNYYVVIWFISGKGFHIIDLERFELEPGTVYCLAPGQVHQLVTEGPVEGYVISFTNEFIGESASQVAVLFGGYTSGAKGYKGLVTVTEEMRSELEIIVSQLQKEFVNFFLLRSEILRDYLRIFLVYLSRRSELPQQPAAIPKGAEINRRFQSLLEKNFMKQHLVSEYASALVVSPGYLNEVVKKVTGFPASHHIRQRIVLEAKRHAMYSGNAMKEIAYELGFDDVAHFSKFFKAVAGMSFTDFKKSYERL
ncbi:MAG: helix-turn-helix transcriptional regulator [Chitinophagaceae bacterium]